jgi:SulP family sulfate permease
MEDIFNPKLFSLLKEGIRKKQILKDIMAGIVVGVVSLPLAIAFAVASGVSPEKGLITAIIAGFIISLLGGSRVQIGGPTGAFIIIVFGIVEKYGLNGLLISTILAGIILVIFGLLRLGVLLKYFPHPLIVGFTSGIALVIFSTELKDAFGLNIQHVPSDFIGKVIVYVSNLSNFNPYAVILTILTILITIYSKKFTSKIPGAFIAIVLTTLAVKFLNLPVLTIKSLFGEIPTTFSFMIPIIDLSTISIYFAPALTIALLCGIESLLSAVVADGMIGSKHRSNTELIAQGFANIITPFFGGIPATGAIARTATNVKNGGRTPIAGIVHSITLLLIMLFLGKWATLIPMASLAGILIVVAYNMSEWRSFISILKGSAFDSIILITTFLLTVFVDLTVAIEIGVILSSLLFMKRMSEISNPETNNSIDSDPLEDYSEIPKGISVYEINGPLFFASAREYAEVIKEIGLKSKILIIRMRYVTFIDITGVKNLKDTLKILKKSGVKIVLSCVRPSILNEFEKNHLTDLVNTSNIFDSFDNALEHAKTMLH